MSIYNLSINKFSECSLTWENAIIEYCEDWKGYSTNAHKFYIILILGVFFLRVIQKFWDYRIKFKVKIPYDFDSKFLDILDLRYLEADITVIDFLCNLLMSILTVRIIQVYFIINNYLGGF